MAEYRWTLIDEETAETECVSEVSAQDVPGTPDRWRVVTRTLRTGLSQGVELIEIDNGRLRVAIVPTRGMGIWRAWADGLELGWKSPVRGPVHPCFVPLAEPSGLGWLSGFDELVCRCGLESNGAPDFDERGILRYPLHGRIANRPARRVELIVDDSAGTISLSGVVEETRFHFCKLRLCTTYTTRFGTTRVSWRDEVENFSASPAGIQMLYHTNIGQPQLDAGSQLIAPYSQVAPGDAPTVATGSFDWQNYSAPRAGFAQQVFQLDLLSDAAGQTLVLLKNSAGSSAVRLDFNTRQLPCFTLWRNLVAEVDGYVTGIEPATNFPNPRTVEEEAGRVVQLPPGATWHAELSLDWLLEPTAIAAAEHKIAELQGSHMPKCHDKVIR